VFFRPLFFLVQICFSDWREVYERVSTSLDQYGASSIVILLLRQDKQVKVVGVEIVRRDIQAPRAVGKVLGHGQQAQIHSFLCL